MAFFASALSSARSDINVKLATAEHDAKFSAKGCEEQYTLNRCQLGLPMLLSECNKWESCMHKPTEVLISRISAETAAEVLNAFIHPLSYKTMAILFLAAWAVLYSFRKTFPAPRAPTTSRRESDLSYAYALQLGDIDSKAKACT